MEKREEYRCTTLPRQSEDLEYELNFTYRIMLERFCKKHSIRLITVRSFGKKVWINKWRGGVFHGHHKVYEAVYLLIFGNTGMFLSPATPNTKAGPECIVHLNKHLRGTLQIVNDRIFKERTEWKTWSFDNNWFVESPESQWSSGYGHTSDMTSGEKFHLNQQKLAEAIGDEVTRMILGTEKLPEQFCGRKDFVTTRKTTELPFGMYIE